MGLRVIGIDAGSKKDLVMESGAEHFIDHTASKDVAGDVNALTGGLGAHAVLVLTAANGAYARYVASLRFAQSTAFSPPLFRKLREDGRPC